MTSATENASATVAAPTPSFSYAQAARGLTPTSTSTPSSKTVSGSITPAKDAAPSSITHPQPNPNLHWTDEHSVTKSKERNTLNNVSESHNIHSNKAATSRKSQPLSNGSNSPPSPAYVDSSTSTLPREDDSSSIQNASSESTWENVSQASNLAERGIEGVEKGSKNEQKNDRDSWVKVQKPPQEAPVPTVNIWRQRMEAQSSVKKPETIPSTTVPTSTVSEIVPNSLPQKKAESTSTPPRTKDQEKIQSQKRGDDDAHKSRRSSAKKTSSEEKTRAAPPSIQDQTLWPTPESGLNVGDERKRSQDAAAKAEKEKHAAKGKNQWKHMEIQHTVVFQTPLPNTHARRGGRAAGRGGREGGARTSPSGANGTTSDKRNGSPTSGEFTKRDKDVTARGNSPGKVKRAVSDEPPTRRDSRFANQRDNREPGNAESRSNGKLEDRPNGHGPQHNTFSRHNPSKPNRRNDIPPTDLDKRKDSKGLTELPNGEPSNTEGSGNQQKPVQAPTDEEKKSFTSPELGSRGFGRGGAQPFVGNRRGNIRGKGPHGFHPPGSSHGFQPGFGMVRSPTIPNEPYFGQGNNSRLRGARNQTIPVDNTFGRFPAPFQSANMVAPINTFTGQPAGMYDYPVHPMSAVSYSPYMEQYQKLGSVAMQL
jgi:la-related protein 1